MHVKDINVFFVFKSVTNALCWYECTLLVQMHFVGTVSGKLAMFVVFLFVVRMFAYGLL